MSGDRLSPAQSAYFDAWRGSAAIAVLIGHGFQIFDPNPWPIWGAFSAAAVMVFFVLSGYFIHKSLASNLAKGTPVAFVAARVNRLLPPLVFSLGLTVALWVIAPAVFASGSRAYLEPTARAEFSLTGLLPTAVMINGFAGPTLAANGPLWSLTFEVWYYALAFIFALGRRGVAAAIFALLAVGNAKFAILSIAWLLGHHGAGHSPFRCSSCRRF
jgi:peptidoglycan/LPS O-acetylase OafA/YrhL